MQSSTVGAGLTLGYGVFPGNTDIVDKGFNKQQDKDYKPSRNSNSNTNKRPRTSKSWME